MEVNVKGAVSRRRRAKKIIYAGLGAKIIQRIEEMPGENYHALASYLEAKPNSVRAILSRELLRGNIVTDDAGRYFSDYFARTTYSLAKAPVSAPPASTIAARYWIPAGCIVGALIGYGLSQL